MAPPPLLDLPRPHIAAHHFQTRRAVPGPFLGACCSGSGGAGARGVAIERGGHGPYSSLSVGSIGGIGIIIIIYVLTVFCRLLLYAFHTWAASVGMMDLACPKACRPHHGHWFWRALDLACPKACHLTTSPGLSPLLRGPSLAPRWINSSLTFTLG